MDLTDGVAVVTGGGTGIGAAVADALADRGAGGLLVTYTRSADAAAETVERLRRKGKQAHAVAADVRDESQVRKLAAECERVFGRCDVLVNNAGTTSWIPFDDLDAVTDQIWHDILDVNVVGAFRCARAFAPALAERRGVVVNIGSVSAYRGIGSAIPYGVSKAALLQLTRALAERERAVAPLGATPGPQDVASAVAGLLEADMVPGVDVVIDAGKHLVY